MRILTAIKSFGFQTFLAGTIGYSLYYVCRTSLNVVKKPILDSGMPTMLLFTLFAIMWGINGWLIDGNSILVETLDEATGQMAQVTQYDFTPAAIFWVVASIISFLLPVLNWKYRK